MRRLHLGFDGKIDEFARLRRRDLWLNVLLGGFYTPAARRHAARFLAQHTLVDGTPLEHVAPAKSPWPALLLIGLFLAVRIATDLGHGPPLPLVVLCGMLLLPYLWGVTTVRGIGSLRWRGLPFGFHAGWREIYRESWPLYVIGLPWAAAAPHVAAAAAPGGPGLGRGWIIGLATGAALAFPLAVRLAFNYTRLKLTRTRIGDHAVAWDARYGEYLRIWCASVAGFVGTVAVPLLALRYLLFGSFTLDDMEGAAAIAVPLASIVLAVLLSTPVRAWHSARMFLLVWDRLRLGDRVHSRCTLDVRGFTRLRVRNLARSRAAAAIEAYTARLHSVVLSTS